MRDSIILWTESEATFIENQNIICTYLHSIYMYIKKAGALGINALLIRIYLSEITYIV